VAEDLIQETFLKALCSMELSQDAVLPWLLRVAKNLYIDAWRRQRHHTEAKGGRAVLLCGAFPGRYRKAAGNESWKCAGHAAPCETETKEPIRGLIKKVGL